MTLKEELDAFYIRYNIPENGGEDDKTFEVPLPGFTLRLPNYNWRRRMLHVHDLEHIVNQQDTTWRGEMYIASWEIATGFWRYFPISTFPFWTMGFGLWKHPVSVFRGFMQGCRDKGIATLGMPKDEILKLTADELKQRIKGKARLRAPLLRYLKFGFFAFVAQLYFLLPFILLFLFFLIIIRF
ncbi:MAG: hypothetical protein H6Q20_625 [Bacteroidetes bacterium]|nr:hypothetical protein [Bacteroidota bacterium]